MSITLGFTATGQDAAEQFIQQLQTCTDNVKFLSKGIEEINSKGEILAQTFKAITTSGEKIAVTIQQTATGWKLVAAEVDRATQSLKDLKAQEEATAAAGRRTDANKAEATLGGAGLLNTQNLNINQVNATEAALQRVRSLIESGSVSLARFQQIYTQIQSNPKAIIPNLTADEASLSRALRTLQQGFAATGQSAQKAGTYLISFAGIVRLFEAQVVKRITGALQSQFIESIKDAREFSIKIAEIQTISQSAAVTTEQWSEGIRSLSSQFGASQADVAEGAYQTISNQIAKGTETFEFMNTAMRFGQATVSSTADSVNLLSGAMKNFNIPTQDAERVASIFFKTIELGRVRAKDMADTFGRVGSIASEAGVKLEEVAAAIASITVRGVKFSDASTLISNILLKLVRPTTEMKKLFDEWGVASGTAAISTFGFSGVLQRLDVEAEKGTARLGELFNQIRALRGAFNLTGGAFQDYERALAQITGGQGEFNNAVEIVQQSVGRRLEVQMNKLKVAFTETFGDAVIKKIVETAEGLGGLDNVIRVLDETLNKALAPVLALANGIAGVATTLFGLDAGKTSLERIGNVIGYTTAAFITYQGILVATNIVTGALKLITIGLAAAQAAYTGTSATATAATITSSTAMAALTGTTTAATTATTGLGVALSALSAFVLPFVAAFAGYSLGQYLFSEADARRIDSVIRNVDRLSSIRLQNRQINDPETRVDRNLTEETRAAFNTRFQVAALYYAKELQLAISLKQRAIDNLKDMNDVSKISAKTYFDSITDRIKKIHEAATEAKGIIERSLKITEDIVRKSNETIYSERIKFASEGRIDIGSGLLVDEQKTGLLQARIGELITQARAKYREGSKESIEDARKLFENAERLQADLFNAQVSNQRRQFDENVRRGLVAPSQTGYDPVTGQLKQRYDFLVNTQSFEEQINNITRERLALEEQVRRTQARRRADAEAEAAQERERLRTLQQAFEAITKIELFNRQGQLKPEYKADRTTALNEFDRQAGIIRNLAGSESFGDQFRIFSDLARQRQALEATVNAAIVEDDIRTGQERLGIQRRATDEIITRNAEIINRANGNITSGLRNLSRSVAILSSDDKEQALRNIGGARITNTAPNSWKDVIDAKNSLQNLQTTFERASTPDNAVALAEAIQRLSSAYTTYAREVSRNGNLEEITFQGDNTNRSISQRVRDLEVARREILEGVVERGRGRQQQIDLQGQAEQLGATLGNIPNILQIITEGTERVGRQSAENIQTITQSLEQQIRMLNRAAQELAVLNAQLPEIRGERIVPNPIEGNIFGGLPKYLSTGGFVPRGSDIVPAMIGRKEIVMTETATQSFLPLLRAMNSGALQSRGSSGNVTNVGDINLNIEGGNTSESTLRNVAKGLRRGIRRGTISLGN